MQFAHHPSLPLSQMPLASLTRAEGREGKGRDTTRQGHDNTHTHTHTHTHMPPPHKPIEGSHLLTCHTRFPSPSLQAGVVVAGWGERTGAAAPLDEQPETQTADVCVCGVLHNCASLNEAGRGGAAKRLKSTLNLACKTPDGEKKRVKVGTSGMHVPVYNSSAASTWGPPRRDEHMKGREASPGSPQGTAGNTDQSRAHLTSCIASEPSG